MKLPEPSFDALNASNILKERIAHEIEQHQGWISFARYMELALYEPALGYYSGGATNIGKEGDFITAPEMTPLFGASLAQAILPIMEQTRYRILEFGAGTGRLAFDILTELTRRCVTVERYEILELSGELRQRQQERLQHFPEVIWLDTLPETFSGIVIGNEVLDAIPVQLIIKKEISWRELGVGIVDQALTFSERDCDELLLSQISTQIPDHENLLPGYVTEVHLYANAFINSVAHMLYSGDGGAAIFIDYGFSAYEYYLPQRNKGTLMCHYRHHAHDNPFYLPGLQDITSHIDFSLIAKAAIDEGLELLCYTSQAAFLLGAGITELMLRISLEDTKAYFTQTQAVQMLLSPTEMGELFKVIVLGKEVNLPFEWVQYDRSDKL